MKRFLSKHYLFVTFLGSLIIGTLAALAVYDVASKDALKAQSEADEAITLIAIIVVIGLLCTWPRWFLMKLNSLVNSAIETLGGSDEESEVDFEKRAGAFFGKEFVSNIFSYETYCKNEYVLDMRKHHLAWLMLAVSGSLTVIAALLVVFARGDDAKWLEAIGVTLPALVTGVLLKIWLETRENLNRTRERTDTIYRQRIRLLLLIGNHIDRSKLADSITLNRQILDYINMSQRPEESQARDELSTADT